MAGNFMKVARKGDLEPGTGKTVDVGGTLVALFNVDGSFYAIHNTCRHRQGPLGEGDLSATEVTIGQFREFVTDTGHKTDAEMKPLLKGLE